MVEHDDNRGVCDALLGLVRGNLELLAALVESPPQEIDIMRNAAAQFARGEEQALLVCRVYFPDMPLSKAREFLKWLAKQSGVQAGGTGGKTAQKKAH